MKTTLTHSNAARGDSGFTLPEMMIASTLFILMTTAIIGTFLFGLHLHKTAEVKLGGNDDARRAIISVTDEIRSATQVRIGAVIGTNFTQVATNGLQIGSAIQIHATSDTNSWIRYFCQVDPASTNYARLCRVTSANPGAPTVVIRHAITNSGALFSSEDSHGVVLDNNQNNRVIGLNLQIYQIEYPVIQVGQTVKHDYYQLRTRITRRRLY